MKLNILSSAGKNLGRIGLKASKYSPEIFLGAGIGCVICGAVSACKATLKAGDILEEKKENIEKINRVREAVKSDDPAYSDYTEETYSDQDYRKDMFIVYSQTAKRFLKLYGPAIGLGIVGIGSILYGHNILNKRNVAITAAYTAVQEGFSEYRKRVIGELGDEADKRFLHGTTKKDIEVESEDEEGNTKTEKVKDAEIIEGYSKNAKFFDSSSYHWVKSPEYNLLFLQNIQSYANNILQTRGHLFLNEVYDMLDIPRTPAGAVEGWLKDGPNGYVDFGIFNAYDDAKRKFVNGYENVILLDFNVDGEIYHMI